MVSVTTIATPGLGDRSYVVTDGRAAVVVDPQRDLDRFRAVLDRLGVPLTHVLETHIHNDYVSGGLELARAAGATYVVAAAEQVGYDRHGAADGQELDAGGMRIRVVATPGHTPHHLAYVVDDTVVFTGGSLLYGTVGRTDLAGLERTGELTRAQYHSVRRLLAELPAACDVLPTHGFGSFCSSSAAPPRDRSTIGQERRGNLAEGNEEEFTAALLGGLTDYPRYYAHMAPINRAGPPPVNLDPPESLDAAALQQRVAAGAWVVDLRGRRRFAAAHLPGTVNIGAGDGLATYLGWVVPWGAPVTLLSDRHDDLGEAQRALARIGIDRLAGRATSQETWDGSYTVAGFGDLAAVWPGDDRAVLDVRRDDEWAEGHLAGALHIPLPELEARAGEVPDAEVWVHCRSGYRAAIGASLLARAGRRVVLVDDDFEDAAAAGLSLEA